MNKSPTSSYLSTFFRVSLKAIIENDKGEVLCVKDWRAQRLIYKWRVDSSYDANSLF